MPTINFSNIVAANLLQLAQFTVQEKESAIPDKCAFVSMEITKGIISLVASNKHILVKKENIYDLHNDTVTGVVNIHTEIIKKYLKKDREFQIELSPSEEYMHDGHPIDNYAKFSNNKKHLYKLIPFDGEAVTRYSEPYVDYKWVIPTDNPYRLKIAPEFMHSVRLYKSMLNKEQAAKLRKQKKESPEYMTAIRVNGHQVSMHLINQDNEERIYKADYNPKVVMRKGKNDDEDMDIFFSTAYLDMIFDKLGWYDQFGIDYSYSTGMRATLWTLENTTVLLMPVYLASWDLDAMLGNK